MAIKKKVLLLVMVIILCLCLCGCKIFGYLPKRTEIDSLEFIRILGIDMGSQDSENIKVTMLYIPHEKEQGGQKDSSNQGGQANISTMVAEGKGLSDAIKNAQLSSKRKIFLGHVFGVIIGDEAAKNGLGKYIDFISRGIELRLDNNIYIAKDMDAEELIKKSSQSDEALCDIVEHFSKDYGITSTSGNKKLIEIMGELDNKYAGIVIPAIKLMEEKEENFQEGNGEEAREKVVIKLDGYGVLKDGKLISYADEYLSTGINILNDKYMEGNITIQDPYGQDVSLEVFEVIAEKRYKFSNGNIESVALKIIVNSNLAEQHSRENIYTKEGLEYLFEQQADTVKKEVYDVIEFAQNNNVDVLGFSRDIFKKHPIKWEKIEPEWDSIFPNLDIDINIKSKIGRTYDITQPSGVEGME